MTLDMDLDQDSREFWPTCTLRQADERQRAEARLLERASHVCSVCRCKHDSPASEGPSSPPEVEVWTSLVGTSSLEVAVHQSKYIPYHLRFSRLLPPHHNGCQVRYHGPQGRLPPRMSKARCPARCHRQTTNGPNMMRKTGSSRLADGIST